MKQSKTLLPCFLYVLHSDSDTYFGFQRGNWWLSILDANHNTCRIFMQVISSLTTDSILFLSCCAEVNVYLHRGTGNYSHFPAAACGITHSMDHHWGYKPNYRTTWKKIICKDDYLNRHGNEFAVHVYLFYLGCFHFKQLTMKAIYIDMYTLQCWSQKKHVIVFHQHVDER